MKSLKGVYYYLGLWLYEIAKEVVSRILSIVFFPIALIFQKRIRAYLYSIDEALVKERTFEDTLNLPTLHFYKKVNMLVFFIWMFLDDSTGRDSYFKDGSVMYSASDNPVRYPEWINKLDWYWLKATWWSFLRNNTVNYVSWFKTAGWYEPIDYDILWGEYNKAIDKSDDNTYYEPGMYLIRVKHNDYKYYTRFTYVGEITVPIFYTDWIGVNIFGRSIKIIPINGRIKLEKRKTGIWQGRSKNSGRFSFSIRM